MYMKTKVSARWARLLSAMPTAAPASGESECTWYCPMHTAHVKSARMPEQPSACGATHRATGA